MTGVEVLKIADDELNLEYTLASGQTFRWSRTDDGWWTGVVRGSVVCIRSTKDGLEWQTYPEASNIGLVTDYFRLSEHVEAIYAQLARADRHTCEVVQRFRGLRLVNQEPHEALLSFVCSAANSIPRISSSVERLSRHYGKPLALVHGAEYYSFPSVESLASADPKEIEAIGGLGFRGRILNSVANQILEQPPGWLESLRHAPYEEAKAQLVTLRGVGQKIADCVCLFALGKDEAVPVDTHVRQLACRYYLCDLTAKTVTDSVYARVTDCLRHKFDGYAGWAQQFLFLEDLLRGKDEASR